MRERVIYCPSCGSKIFRGEFACPNYGVAVNPGSGADRNRVFLSPLRSQVTAAILTWFFGFLGIHRFYIGKRGTGFLLFAMGALGLILTIVKLSWFSIFLLAIAGTWATVDFIAIVCGKMTDGDSRTID